MATSGARGLAQTTVPNVNIHLKNIYAEGELVEEATIKTHLIVRQEGFRQVSRNVLHYNLSAPNLSEMGATMSGQWEMRKART